MKRIGVAVYLLGGVLWLTAMKEDTEKKYRIPMIMSDKNSLTHLAYQQVVHDFLEGKYGKNDPFTKFPATILKEMKEQFLIMAPRLKFISLVMGWEDQIQTYEWFSVDPGQTRFFVAPKKSVVSDSPRPSFTLYTLDSLISDGPSASLITTYLYPLPDESEDGFTDKVINAHFIGNASRILIERDKASDMLVEPTQRKIDIFDIQKKEMIKKDIPTLYMPKPSMVMSIDGAHTAAVGRENAEDKKLVLRVTNWKTNTIIRETPLNERGQKFEKAFIAISDDNTRVAWSLQAVSPLLEEVSLFPYTKAVQVLDIKTGFILSSKIFAYEISDIVFAGSGLFISFKGISRFVFWDLKENTYTSFGMSSYLKDKNPQAVHSLIMNPTRTLLAAYDHEGGYLWDIHLQKLRERLPFIEFNKRRAALIGNRDYFIILKRTGELHCFLIGGKNMYESLSVAELCIILNEKWAHPLAPQLLDNEFVVKSIKKKIKKAHPSHAKKKDSTRKRPADEDKKPAKLLKHSSPAQS